MWHHTKKVPSALSCCHTKPGLRSEICRTPRIQVGCTHARTTKNHRNAFLWSLQKVILKMCLLTPQRNALLWSRLVLGWVQRNSNFGSLDRRLTCPPFFWYDNDFLDFFQVSVIPKEGLVGYMSILRLIWQRIRSLGPFHMTLLKSAWDLGIKCSTPDHILSMFIDLFLGGQEISVPIHSAWQCLF